MKSGSAAVKNRKENRKQNWENWQKEVDKKSSFKLYKKVKEGNGL